MAVGGTVLRLTCSHLTVVVSASHRSSMDAIRTVINIAVRAPIRPQAQAIGASVTRARLDDGGEATVPRILWPIRRQESHLTRRELEGGNSVDSETTGEPHGTAHGEWRSGNSTRALRLTKPPES